LGLSGAKNFWSGTAGFYPTYFRGIKYNTSKLIEALGNDYQILNVATKPYPACGFTMAPIDNVINIIETQSLKASQIKKIRIRTNEQMYRTVCTPLENKYQPKTKGDALFSLPYTIATAVIKGDVRLEDFSEDVLNNENRLEMMQKIEIINDEEMTKEAVEINLPLGTHTIEVLCNNGTKHVNKLNFSTGFPQKPMTLEECANKAKKVLPFSFQPLQDEKIDALKDTIENLEELEDINYLLNFII